MKKLLIILSLILSINTVTASTIKETTIDNDEYDTIEPNTFIIGVTKFSGDEVITAKKAVIAGANNALTYAKNNNTTKNYEQPVIYLYLGSDIGWFKIDEDNKTEIITDEETLNKLSSIDIYYVSNQEKDIN